MPGQKIRAKVIGLDEAIKRLKSVEQKLRGKVLRKAMAAADKVVLAEARRRVPVESGLLKKSLGHKVKVYGSGVIVGIVGPRAGFKKTVVLLDGRGAIAGTKKAERLQQQGGQVQIRNPLKYAHLVERIDPFLRPALDSQRAAAVGAMGNVIAAEMAKA